MTNFSAKRQTLFILAAWALGGIDLVNVTTIAFAEESTKEMMTSINYPQTRKEQVSDEYFGTSIGDPYRWLEDTESADTAKWVETQNEVTFKYLEKLPYREKLKSRLSELWNYERYGLPKKIGNKYFYTHNDGLQNQAILYTADTLQGERKLLLDPNTLRDDGTVALSGWVPSHDGKLLAYGLAAAGSDWNTWRVRDVDTATDKEDLLEWIKFSSVSWTLDGKGFFYSRFDAPEPGKTYSGINYYQKLYYHRLGTAQDDDVLIYKRDDEKEWGFAATVTDDGNYCIITVSRGTEDKTCVFYFALVGQSLPEQVTVTELVREFKYDYRFVGNDLSRFYFYTDRDAPRRKVVAIDVDVFDEEAKEDANNRHWETIIGEQRDTLEDVSVLGERFICNYLHDATTAIRKYGLDGKLIGEVELPAIGTSVGFEGERYDDETFFSFTNYITPPSVFRIDLNTDKVELFREPKVSFLPADYETEQVFVTSKDGTKLPMILSYKKGMKKDGNTPTMLYAYGGFNISLTPAFSATNLVWMEMGGIFAVPNLRGGGEYGREWHESGMLDKKQNVFDDYIAAAEYLIENKYTSSKRLAIMGGSNGGLLVGASITQHPELFGAAVAKVGVMDMLRFHKFTIGWAWVNEYGSSDDAKQFKNLLSYSPLHNLKDGSSYPATLVMTADHDDRVVPGHSFKFAARLQEAHRGDSPTLIRIETRSGHGAGTPVSKIIEAAADQWAFVAENLQVR